MTNKTTAAPTTPSTSNASTPVTESATTAAEPIRVAPQPQGQKPCPLCFRKEKHGVAPADTKCVACGNAHGAKVKLGERDRKVVIRHSLAIAREGGRDEHGNFVNPKAPWIAPAICDDCGWGVKRNERGNKSRERTRFYDLAENVAEASARNELDQLTEQRGIGFRMGVLARRSRKDLLLAPALAEELAAAQRLNELARAFSVVPVRQIVLGRVKTEKMLLDEAIDASMAEVNAAYAEVSKRALPYLRQGKGGGGPRHERGDRRDGKGWQPRRDKRGNPNLGGRGYVTPDDVAADAE